MPHFRVRGAWAETGKDALLVLEERSGECPRLSSESGVAGKVSIERKTRAAGKRSSTWYLRHAHPIVVGADPVRWSTGVSNKHAAEQVRQHVERLMAARLAGVEPEAATVAWVIRAPARIRRCVIKYGLAAPDLLTKLREHDEAMASGDSDRALVTLQEIAKLYRDSPTRGGVPRKPSGAKTIDSCLAVFERFWRDLDPAADAKAIIAADITPDAAFRFQSWLVDRYALATVRSQLRMAKLIISHGVRRGLLDRNPFDGLVTGVIAGEKRVISDEVGARVLAELARAEDAALFALAFYGGLRCDSETHAITWADIDLPAARMAVPSSKRSAGQVTRRVVPIRPELADRLEALAEVRGVGVDTPNTQRVVLSHKDGATRRMLRAIEAAGVSAWPKPWQTLRQTAASRWASQFPPHVSAAWIGHGVEVERRHYLAVSEEQMRAAAGRQGGTKEGRGFGLTEAHGARRL